MGRQCTITTKIPWPDGQKHTDANDGFVSAFRYKYPSYTDVIIRRFEAYTGRQMHWENLNSITLTMFRDGCLGDVSRNSSAEYCKHMAAVIRLYGDANNLQYAAMRSVLTVRMEQGTFVFVTEDEMNLLVDFYRSEQNATRKAVCAMAIMEFYTGARRSDTESFTESNIDMRQYIERASGSIKDLEMLTYTSVKTHIKASIPVKPIVREILSDETIKDVELNTQKIDWHIKNICRDAGLVRIVRERRAGKEEDKELYKCVTSHTFRRSFATNLDRKGVGIETTSRMMGHTNTQQTRRYICGDTLVLDEETMNFFK